MTRPNKLSVRPLTLRTRPEPTQMEHLSDASFLGMLLVSPAKVRLDWKEIAKYKQSNLFGLIISNEGKKFYNIDTSGLKYKCFMIIIYNRNDSGQYYKTRITIVIDNPS